jgi:integrase
MGFEIDKVDARNRLAARHEPYWARISAGCHLGFQKLTPTSTGTWVAKFRDADTGKRSKLALGEFDTLPAAQRFDAACKAARERFEHLGRGGSTESVTVKQICANYVKHLRDAGRMTTASDAEGRFKRWVNDAKLGSIPMQKLKAADLSAWRAKLASTPATPQDKTKTAHKPRAASSLNREMATLKAALNLAVDDGIATDDTPWRLKLKPIKDADGRRDVYLDGNQRRALIAKAQADMADFLRAMSLVPLRPGAIAALTAGDFDKRLATLRIGKDKTGKDRKITLPPATATFFEARCKDKLPGAPLVARADGRAWDRDSWKGPVKDAVMAAELPPAATAYALRHSTITDLLTLHKLDTLTVAQLSATSLLMIEKHYGHLLRDHAAKALAGLTV